MVDNITTKLDTPKFTIEIDDENEHGCFEHKELGDECGGGLWFSGKELIDYDGVTYLPKQVAKALRDAGFIVDETFD